MLQALPPHTVLLVVRFGRRWPRHALMYCLVQRQAKSTSAKAGLTSSNSRLAHVHNTPGSYVPRSSHTAPSQRTMHGVATSFKPSNMRHLWSISEAPLSRLLHIYAQQDRAPQLVTGLERHNTIWQSKLPHYISRQSQGWSLACIGSEKPDRCGHWLTIPAAEGRQCPYL